MDPKDWPDYMHLKRICEFLWRPTSRASVMVGAGMSRNARKRASGVPDFPLWHDVLSVLVQDLYPGEKTSPGSDVMRIGQEYIETYGRAALDDRLKKLIADEQYEPGELHKRLLSLPWAEVFTTNYDCLLERTLPFVFDRKYDVVLTLQGLVHAERPRIVKLHGSFPEHRPFIFTSEDYRRYPDMFAPFVNTVRQAVIENHLCLIGFSGDDPNFLQWIGWVRDQLGTSMRHVYLCGVLDFSESRRRYFQTLHIIPVDLGTLFSKEWDPRRHEVALDWFLTSLHNGQPVDDADWPARKVTHQCLLSRDEHMPVPLTTTIQTHIPPAPPVRSHEEEDDAYYKEVLTAFRIRRQTYPGWIVCPERNRNSLFRFARDWFYGLRAVDKRTAWLRQQPVLQRARALHEYACILRLCLLPLPNWIDELIVEILESFNPKPTRISIERSPSDGSKKEAAGQAIVLTPKSDPSEKWNELTDIWVELAFALVNYAWQMQDAGKHGLWMGRLQNVVCLKEEWQARYAHAQAWHHLLRLDEEGVRGALCTWPDLPGQPFWQAQRAAMLAEIGEVEQAQGLARAALERVRSAINHSCTDYKHKSQEGWILVLLLYLESAKQAQDRDSSPVLRSRDEYVARLEILDTIRCDPDADFKERERKLLSLPRKSERRFKQPGFEIGAYRTTRQFFERSAEEWVLVQSFCDGPIPFGFHGSSKKYDDSALAIAVRGIWEASPQLAVSIGLRTAERNDAWNALHTLLDRAGVAELPQDAADKLYQWLASALRRAMMHWRATGKRLSELNRRLLERGPEIISRLLLRIADEHFDDAFDLAVKMHLHEFYLNSRDYEPLSSMWKRLFTASPAAKQQAWLPQLIELNIPNLGASPWDRYFPEPSDFLEAMASPSCEERACWAQAIDTLIANVRASSSFVRKRSCLRLTCLAEIGVLDEEQKRRLADAIWSQCDDTGLPRSTGIHAHALLDLPDSKNGRGEHAVREYFLATSQPADADISLSDVREYLASLQGATSVPWRVQRAENRRIEWNAREQVCLTERISSMVHKCAAVSVEENVWSLARRTSATLFAVLASGSAFQDAATRDAIQGALQRIQDDISERGAFIMVGPLLSLFRTDSHDEQSIAACTQAILRSLHELDPQHITGAIQAIHHWFLYEQCVEVFPKPPQVLLDELIGNAVSRRQPGLTQVLTGLIGIVRDVPAAITDAYVEAIRRVLGYIHEDLKVTLASRGRESDLSDLLARHERLEHFSCAVHLAAVLAKLLEQRRQPIPEDMESWREFANNAPLPEVRRIWQSVPSPPSIAP